MPLQESFVLCNGAPLERCLIPIATKYHHTTLAELWSTSFCRIQAQSRSAGFKRSDAIAPLPTRPVPIIQAKWSGSLQTLRRDKASSYSTLQRARCCSIIQVQTLKRDCATYNNGNSAPHCSFWLQGSSNAQTRSFLFLPLRLWPRALLTSRLQTLKRDPSYFYLELAVVSW